MPPENAVGIPLATFFVEGISNVSVILVISASFDRTLRGRPHVCIVRAP